MEAILTKLDQDEKKALQAFYQCAWEETKSIIDDFLEAPETRCAYKFNSCTRKMELLFTPEFHTAWPEVPECKEFILNYLRLVSGHRVVLKGSKFLFTKETKNLGIPSTINVDFQANIENMDDLQKGNLIGKMNIKES
ncbi:BA71V-A137R (p11.5) [African swine fever virus]|nr:BA71V-A137R (p11.5) [African swine fever virus]AJL34221.1 BA71V-A137R (p11.5) [African swine fever virus]WEG42091.1 BA71V-A137R (p11.5) [African swine fever virus]CAK8178815.1 pA137R [African swine fever virus]CAK8179531.1 pA137R [African swine fever virus]CAK8179704.1 pA137R [African swine fever virus]